MLKKTLSILLALVLVVGLIPVHASAQESGEVTWEEAIAGFDAVEAPETADDEVSEIVAITPINGYTGNAVMDKQFPETEPNSSFEDARVVFHDYTVLGTLEGKDVDIFGIQLTQDSELSFISLSSAQGLAYLLYSADDLENPLASSVDVGYDSGTGFWGDGIIADLTAGVYYIVMIDLNASYVEYLFYVSVHGHTWNEGVVNVPATCTTDGEMTVTCTDPQCGFSAVKTIPAGHTWDKGVVATPATYSAPGVLNKTCTVCGATTTEAIAQLANPFTDVAAGSYYYNAVLWALDRQVTTGMTATTFAPDATCTRGQVVTFLYRAAGKPEVTAEDRAANPFRDVAAGGYYYDAVLWAVKQGITKGTSATAFSPDAPCTRGQVVTFLHRAQGAAEPAGAAAAAFTDVVSGEYYEKAVAWAVEKGVTNGLSATTFGPNATCTRGQIVTFLYRAKTAQ